MRHLAACCAAVLVVGLAACGVDPPTCEAVGDAAAAGLGLPATYAVKAPGPASRDGAPRWYYASATGGLWIAFADPMALDRISRSGEDPGLIVPVNDQARAESDVGTAASSGSGILTGTTSSGQEARRALACGRQGTADPRS